MNLRFNTYWPAREWLDEAYDAVCHKKERYAAQNAYGQTARLARPFREADHEGVCRDHYWWVDIPVWYARYIPQELIEALPSREDRMKFREYATTPD